MIGHSSLPSHPDDHSIVDEPTNEETNSGGYSNSNADLAFQEQLTNLAVGETAPLIEFEALSGYGRIAIEKTPEGDADILKVQKPASGKPDGHIDLETIANVGRWFSNEASWEHIHDPAIQ